MIIARSWFVITLFVLLSLAIAVRIVFLHVVDKDFLQDQGDARTIRMERINAHRGMIKDRNGQPLAISSPVVSLWANPQELLSTANGVELISKGLNIPREDVRTKLQQNSGSKFVYLRRRLTPPEARRIMQLGIKGVYEEREYKRFYPAGEVTAHLVGFTDIDDKGQEGFELSYNDWLEGTPGKKKVLKNLYGDIIRDIKPVREARPGKDLALSIDLRVQYLAYRELKSAVNHYKAASGSVVLLDVDTGEIIAMANQPSFNPNKRSDLTISAVRNRAVTDTFEPGSTVKPFTVATALRSGDFGPGSLVDTHPGFIKVDGKTIRDPLNRGKITLTDIIAHSSQVGISKLALDLNGFKVREMFRDVGFGEVSGIGFPGEGYGYLPDHRRWSDIERVTLAYGYGLTVTPLQLAASYLTIASGGIKRQISALRALEVKETRVLEKEVADDLLVMLRRVVTDGTGSSASIDGYPVAGKTGTVRKMGDTGYLDTRHIAFFAGMAPVDNPKVVGVILINDPQSDAYGGGAIAAPVFSRVMSGALRLLNVAPDEFLEAV
ncbi:MAG: penicillin-binding transpeptidase domain-containing protein [Pseudomonadales bacterium]